MADITLNMAIIISDINKDMAIPAFLAAVHMPQIADPEWIDPGDGSTANMIDEYPSGKKWAEAYYSDIISKNILKQINKGVDIANREVTQPHLTKL